MAEGELPPTPGWKWVAIERPLTEAGEGGLQEDGGKARKGERRERTSPSWLCLLSRGEARGGEGRSFGLNGRMKF